MMSIGRVMSDKLESVGEKHKSHNTLVLVSAIQLGVDIARELLDTGNMVDQVKGEPVDVNGIRNLMNATVCAKLAAVRGVK